MLTVVTLACVAALVAILWFVVRDAAYRGTRAALRHAAREDAEEFR